jgi:serine/threonine protein kinase
VPPIVREAARDPGRRFGRFILVRELGRGTLGVVHQAWDRDLGGWVAIKFLKTEVADPERLERFRREAFILASLDHPNIAGVTEILEIDGQFAIVMKYIEGRTLHEIFLRDSRGPAPIETAVRYIRDASLGLGYAHGRGFIHRDLKPGNLMVDRKSRVYVLDFGLAKTLARSETLTDLERMMGTPAYMSPEQVMGLSRDVDARSDVFSLGTTLWTLLAGHRPFKGRNDVEVARAIVEQPAPSVRTVQPGISGQLDNVLRKAMEKNRADRHSSAVELAADLNDCLVSLQTEREGWARFEPMGLTGATITVLMIEDDPSVVSLVRKYFKKDDLEIINIADGAEAMDRAEEVAPNIVLLDINLPGMSGWEILERMRAISSFDNVPIIMLTGERGEENVVRGFQLGANDYVEKPFSLPVLRARMRGQLLRHSIGI